MRLHRLLPPAALSVAALSLAACADAPTGIAGPSTPTVAPSASTSSGTNNSYIVTQTTKGDTVETVFVVGTNGVVGATFQLGHSHKIEFPYAAGSICDLQTSTYGRTEWDKACTASAVAVTVTAKVWTNAQGMPQTDFQPAMRFVPGVKKPVMLSLKDKNQSYKAGQQALFCSPSGCVDESLTDPSVRVIYDATNGYWQRPVKHFSGYTMSVGRTEDGGY